ncbi:3-phenylpropionate MFS transporter [Vibrio algivorus]|uniref:3-phenylpropionic acid transporter n=1 Tax=Vibrio algivorus TaxID=1667024 RepID=A0ABQ6EIV9_9VIBR|nr:3-phenylpropionate MFS transporter [Vibrio algivorus]GLT13068.1 3-phenylpropionic acid transporter [Vibrio algivorus]
MLNPTPFGWISQYFFGFFFAYGVYLPFWSLWFSEQGVSASDIGLLIGLGFATRCVVNLVLTPKLHKVEHLLPSLRVLTFIALIFCALHFFTGGNFWWLALATIGFNATFGPGIPLSDSVANYYNKLNLLDYGRSRLWGSVAFIVGSSLVGYLVNGFGSDMIVYTAMAGLLVTLLLSLRQPTPLPETRVGSEQQAKPSIFILLKQWPIVKFLILVSLLQGSHAAYYSFSTLHWKEVGISESVIGYLWSFSVVSEVLLFAFSARLFGAWSLRAMFIVASLAVVVRWCGVAMTNEVWLLALLQTLHGLTFALTHYATIRYIQLADDQYLVPLQGLYNAIPLGAFIALMTALSGWGYEFFGGNVFLLMAVMGIVALFVKVEQPISK